MKNAFEMRVKRCVMRIAMLPEDLMKAWLDRLGEKWK
jgi:hypothetical protein